MTACNNESELHADIVAEIPHLRAFSRSLVHNQARADDLVQATLLRALDNLHRFTPGTNLRAWLFTIQRNLYYSELRKYKNEIEDIDGYHAAKLTTLPQHISAIEFQEFRKALASLPSEQREAVVLVGAAGVSYEEAAKICDCAVGTVKSRVNRGRARLFAALDVKPDADRRNTSRSAVTDAGDIAAPAGR